MSERFTNITITHNNGDTFYAVWDTQTRRIIAPRVPATGNDRPNPAYPDKAWFIVQQRVIEANTVERNKAHATAWCAACMTPGFTEFARSRFGVRFNVEGATWPEQEMLLRRWNEAQDGE